MTNSQMVRFPTRYALLGTLLGLGAPLGSLGWRVLTGPHTDVVSALAWEWQSASYYYIYMTVGTVISFSLFGYWLGKNYEAINALSNTDGLTHIYNHRYLQEQLAQEIERSNRYHTPLTCLMLDIDDFKKVNDQYGHPVGDDVLTITAKLIRETIRQIDVVGRYGGEEFLVIMPQTTNEVALPIAGRIVKAVETHPFLLSNSEVHITVSIGLATYPAPDLGIKNKNGLLSAVDQALYQAKRMGKNQTVVWKP